MAEELLRAVITVLIFFVIGWPVAGLIARIKEKGGGGQDNFSLIRGVKEKI